MAQFYDELIDENQVYYMLPDLGTSEAADEMIERAFRITRNRLLCVAIERLPSVQSKEEFLMRYATSPSDTKLLDYLVQEIGPGIRDDLRSEFRRLLGELRQIGLR